MKNYFDFQLKGKDFLSLWLIFYVLFIIPYVFWVYRLQSFKNVSEKPPVWMIFLFIPLILIAFIWTFYFIRIVLKNIKLKEDLIRCDYDFGQYLGIICLGLFLSVITLGIYVPWFMRNCYRFFVNNSSWKDNNFSFLGKGGKLFIIALLYFILPIFVISFLLAGVYGPELVKNPSGSYLFIRQSLIQIIMIPFIYLVYKWRVNIAYKEYNIKWETEFWPSVLKIFVQAIFTVITFGIYAPMAFLKLYTYFAGKTGTNVVDNQKITFGYDLDAWNDFLFLWGQLLLTAVTLGIYYPWALCKIGKRISEKTYMQKI